MVNYQHLEAAYLFQTLTQNLHWSAYYFQNLNLVKIIELLVFVIFILFVLRLLQYYLSVRVSIQEPSVFLELTPPSFTDQSPYNTEQLFAIMHSLGNYRCLRERLLGIQNRFSLEIVSTKETGIKYLIRTKKKYANNLKRSLIAYLPQLTVNNVTDYLSPQLSKQNGVQYKVLEFSLSNHYAYPLKNQTELNKHDPIAYLTGMMTKLDTQELISLQIVVSPSRPKQVKDITHKIMVNQDVLPIVNQSIPTSILSYIFKGLYTVLSIPIWAIQMLFNDGNVPAASIWYSDRQNREVQTPVEQEIITQIHRKLDQPLFHTTLRVLLCVNDNNSLVERTHGFVSSFASMSNAGWQSLRIVKLASLKVISRLNYFLFQYRLLSIFKSSYLATSEIADIYHFPFTKATKTEDIIKSHSKRLPAPISLKNGSKLDLVFAKNTYGNSITDIGLTEDERRRHMYILGATGTGKSTLLLSMINQDIQHNKGLAVIDPHDELVKQILPLIPEHRMQDVVYFNPDDISYPVGLNLLELTPGLSQDDALREKELIAESIISLFHKLYPERYSGPKMEYILRNTIYTAFTIPDPTLFTIFKLLTNTPFRSSVIKKLTDDNLKDFWKYEFNKAGDYQKVKMIGPITNKIGRFLFSPVAKRILEQKKSTINFDDILDNGKILLCNLSKGRLGEDTSEVFGILVMTKIQLAALKRARIDASKRRDFYLFVDEFQNFATPAFAQILSEARKYKLNAILAHQTVSQLQDKNLVNVTLANTGTVICFRTANPADEQLILPQFAPYIQPGEIANLPSYNFYMKLGALQPQEPFSGETILTNISNDTGKVDRIISTSRKLFAIDYRQNQQSTSSDQGLKKSRIQESQTRHEIVE